MNAALLVMLMGGGVGNMFEPRTGLDPSKGCCVPAEMTAVEGIAAVQTGQTGVILGKGFYALSSKLQQTYYDVYLKTDNRDYHVKKYQVYKKKTEYIVIGDKCTKKRLDMPWKKPCVPKNATLAMAGWYGNPIGQNHIATSMYEVKNKDNVLFVSVTREKECIPITLSMYGSGYGGPHSATIDFLNVTRTVNDPSIFQPPPSCFHDNAQTVPQHDIFETSVLQLIN